MSSKKNKPVFNKNGLMKSVLIVALSLLLTYPIMSSASVNTNPVAYWSFNESAGTVAADSSGNGNNANLLNGPVWVNGKIGSALQFDGINDYVDAGNSTSLQITGAISLVGWVKINNLSVISSLFGRGHGLGSAYSNNGYFLTYYAPTNSIYFDTYSTTTRDSFRKANAINDTNWHHIAATWDGTTSTNGKKLYIDGVLVAQKTSIIASMGNPAYNFRIGIDSLNYYPAKATIDEVKVYNRALSAAEVLADYNLTTSTPTPTPTDTVTPTLTGTISPEYAAYFDGINSSIEVPNSDDLSAIGQKMTVIYTYKPLNFNHEVIPIEKGRPGLYEWTFTHRAKNSTTQYWDLYQYNLIGGYGIGVPFEEPAIQEKITVAGVINNVLPSDRYESIYKNGVLQWGHRSTMGIAGVKMTNAGSGYTVAPTVIFTGGGGYGAAMTAYLDGSQVCVGRGGCTVAGNIAGYGEMDSYGYNYTSDPTVAFTAPPEGGTQATGIAYRVGIESGTSSVFIGGNPYRNHARDITGYIYEVAIFKDELSATDISNLYNGSKQPSDFSSLVMWHNYRLGNANDLSGRGHNGVLKGNTKFVQISSST